MSKQTKQDLLSFILIAVFSFGFYPMVAASNIAFVAATFDRQQVKFYSPDQYHPNRNVFEISAWTNVREKISLQFWMRNPESGEKDPVMRMYVMYKGDPWIREVQEYRKITDLPRFMQDWSRVFFWRCAKIL